MTSAQVTEEIKALVSVKPLEWETSGCGPDEYTVFAKVFGFQYEIEPPYSEGLKFRVKRSIDIQPFAWRKTLDEAKAAAQADYEARILSALSPSARAEAGEAEQIIVEFIRLADLGFEDSMKEPEESGNFAVYERAKRFLAAPPAVAEQAEVERPRAVPELHDMTLAFEDFLELRDTSLEAGEANDEERRSSSEDLADIVKVHLRNAIAGGSEAATDEDWKLNCQYLLDILDNQGFMASDLGEEDEAEVEGIRAALSKEGR